MKDRDTPSLSGLYDPVANSFSDYLRSSAPCSLSDMFYFLHNRDKLVPFIIETLRGKNIGLQYQAVRLASSIRLRETRSLLYALAITHETAIPVRVASFYALKRYRLEDSERTTILDVAAHVTNPLLSRSALVALASTNISANEFHLRDMLNHPDSLTRLYAARLLEKGSGHYQSDVYSILVNDKDPFVRSETYSALGCSFHPEARNLLHKCLLTENNSGALAIVRNELTAQDAIRSGGYSALCSLLISALNSPSQPEQSWAYNRIADDDALLLALSKHLDSLSDEWQQWLKCQQSALLPDKTPSPTPRDFFQAKHNIPLHYQASLYNLSTFPENHETVHPDEEEKTVFLLSNAEEDRGVSPINHAYNPLTGRGFIRKSGIGGSALDYATSLVNDLSKQSTLDGWKSMGRAFHVFQDLASPLHVFCVWHPFNTCLFESYWTINLPAFDAILAGFPTSIHQSEGSGSLHIDSITQARLSERINVPLISFEDYVNAMAWTTYFTCSYWGSLYFSDVASSENTPLVSFDDGDIPAQPNTLSQMFEGKIDYRTSWSGEYFSISDTKENEFYWNRCFLLDGFRPCANPGSQNSIDGHTWAEEKRPDGDIPFIIGRFFFVQRGFFANHCYPHYHPDRSPMNTHLVHYYGEALFPFMVQYGREVLNLFADILQSAHDNSLLTIDKALNVTSPVSIQLYSNNSAHQATVFTSHLALNKPDPQTPGVNPLSSYKLSRASLLLSALNHFFRNFLGGCRFTSFSP